MAYTAIDDGSEYFHTQLYTGSGSSGLEVRNNANSGNFSPDWLWVKPRSASDNHVLFDSTRGFDKQLKANGSDAEDTHSPAKFTRETNGFDIDSTDGNYNGNSVTYVAWQWKCNNATTSTNNDGSVAVTLQTNSTAGFSIGTFTGTGNSSGTIGHGLGATPDWLIVKRRDGSENWNNIFANVDSKLLRLNTDGASFTGSAINSVGASTFTDGNGNNAVFYAFKSIQGYSKFGSFTGNGNANGPFIYTGFKPAWLMIKPTSRQNHWHMFDNKRNPENPLTQHILADLNNSEATNSWGDMLSNGFKLRTTLVGVNGDGDTYVYMAFAEHPFVSSEGVPTTAR